MNSQPHTFDSRVLALFGLIAVLSTIGCGGGGSPINNSPPVTFTVGGTVSGLAGTGLVLQDNGGNNLTVSANGSFTFTTALASGTAYSVTVSTQPSTPTQTCVVTSGTGTVSSNVTSVAVACTTNTYSVGGTVSGLSGSGLVLQDNGGNNLAVSAGGAFTFTTAIASATAYSVTVLTQPTNLSQTCVPSSNTGTVTSSNVTNISVVCTTDTFTVGGTVSGLAGTGLVLQDNGGDSLAVTANGSFTFTTAVASGTAYSVTVLTQPSDLSQTCVPSLNTGTVTSKNVTNVSVICTTDTFTVGGTVSGLAGTGLVLQDNGGNNLAVSANGPFTFTTKLASGTTYTVTVLTQPSNSAQTCGVTSGSGTVTSGVVNTVAVTCVTSSGQAFTALTAAMTTARYDHTATLLPNGQVLITGGFDGSFAGLNTAELYNPTAGTFTALTATMTTPRYGHTATLLPSGQVLITGGLSNSTTYNSAEVYDPVANTFTALTATMTTARAGHTATLLPNGKVLITGGLTGGTGLDTAELYDPVANAFTTVTATMTTARSAHTATLLPNGLVLLAGGNGSTSNLNTAELYNPTAQTFTALTATMTTARDGHTATLLPDGMVLITGGYLTGPVTGPAYNTAELYNPTAQTFTALTATMTSDRANHAATLLPSGLVLLTGGTNGSGTPGDEPALNTAEVYEALPPSVKTFTALTATMTTVRTDHTSTLLPTGLVLLTGGCNNSTALNTAELYNPTTNTFTALTATMTTARIGHTATLLPTGQVLITGGFNNLGSEAPLNSAELYDPVANTFTALTATMTTVREQHMATLLPNGLVLITGGWNSSFVALDAAELYNPTTQTFTALTATMTSGRVAHTSTLLPNGQVLIAGGGVIYGVNTLNTAELYDPVANTFTALTATMTALRGGHIATLLPSGQVLIAGGFSLANGSGTVLNSAELYNPVAQTFTALTATMTTVREFAAAALLPNGLVLITGGSPNGSAAFSTGTSTAEVYAP